MHPLKSGRYITWMLVSFEAKILKVVTNIVLESENTNILTCILRSAEEPVLNRVQMQRVFRAHRAHALYLRNRDTLTDSDDDDGPQDDDAWLYEDLKVLAKLYARLRDREQIISLIFEVGVSMSLAWYLAECVDHRVRHLKS